MNVLLILSLSLSFLYSEQYQDIKISRIDSVYDGDTIFVDIDSYPDIIGKRIGIRVRRIDAPEIRTNCIREKELAHKAKEHVIYFLKKCENIYLRNIERGKFFRIAADVYCDEKSLSQSLIKNNLAFPYNENSHRTRLCD